jgi:hypothetical protein
LNGSDATVWITRMIHHRNLKYRKSSFLFSFHLLLSVTFGKIPTANFVPSSL